MMDLFSTNELSFDDLDFDTINSVMKDEVDFFSPPYCGNGNTNAYYDEADMIDEFLNLDQNTPNMGIYIEEKPKNQVAG